MRGMILLLTLALAACGPTGTETPPEGAPDAAATAAPATPTGAPVTVALAEGAHPEAGVAQVTLLQSGAKIYSVVGGDPAINGHDTYIARYAEAPDPDWRVFQIGDFNSWSVAKDRGGEVVLAVSRSWINDKGEVQTADERMIVSVPDAAATSISVTPAS